MGIWSTSFRVLNCRVEQTSEGTMYNVPEINGTDCLFSWANGTDKVNLKSSSMVFSNITTLITNKSYKSIDYSLGCMTGGFYKAACTANCTENSGHIGLSVGAWVWIAIALVIALAAIALVIYCVIKNSCSSQARSGNRQPGTRYESANNEES